MTEADAHRLDMHRRLAEARRVLGQNATIDALAEHVGVSPRTLRRWQEVAVDVR